MCQSNSISFVCGIGRAKAQRDQDIKVAECTRLEVEAKMEADSTTANNERQFETIRAGYQKEVSG